jgi:hypothetical protein
MVDMDNCRVNSVNDRRRGSALVASLAAVLFIASLGAYLVETQSAFARRQCASIDRKRALYVAEAGLAESVLAVSQGRTGRLGDAETPVRFHAGIYWVESEALADGCVTLTSRARVGVGNFTVRLIVRPNVHQVGNAGFFGAEGVVIGDAVVMDGYDSQLGTYAAQSSWILGFPTPGRGALVRSNQAIVVDDSATWPAGTLDPYALLVSGLPSEQQAQLMLDDPTNYLRLRLSAASLAPPETHVLGVLRPGPGYNVETSGNSTLLELLPSEKEVRLPAVLEPSTRQELAGDTVVVGTSLDLGNVSARGGRLLVTAGGELSLRGPLVLRLDELGVETGGTLRLDDEDGPIHLHIDERLDLAAGSFVDSVGADAPNGGTFVFVEPALDPLQDSRVHVASIGVFRGVIYAPGDRLELPTGLRYFGAAAAKHLTVADGAWLTFDEAIRIGGVGMPVLPKQQVWQIVMEALPPMRVGFDPLADLARRGVTPLDWSNASAEQIAIAEYLDSDGLRQSYNGTLTEAQIDVMERVISLRWLEPASDTYQRPLRPPGMDPDDLIEAHREQLRADRDEGL